MNFGILLVKTSVYWGKINNQSDVPAVILFDQFSKCIHIYEQINTVERDRDRECCMVCVFVHACVCVLDRVESRVFASRTRIGSHVSDWLL